MIKAIFKSPGMPAEFIEIDPTPENLKSLVDPEINYLRFRECWVICPSYEKDPFNLEFKGINVYGNMLIAGNHDNEKVLHSLQDKFLEDINLIFKSEKEITHDFVRNLLKDRKEIKASEITLTEEPLIIINIFIYSGEFYQIKNVLPLTRIEVNGYSMNDFIIHRKE